MRHRIEVLLSVLTISVVCFAAEVQAQTVPSGYQVSSVTAGLSQPTTMAFIAPGEFLVLEKATGRVKYVEIGGPAPTIVLDLDVNSTSERGLLGIALHPDFTTNNYVYLYYTNNTPLEHRIERYTWNGSALTAATSITTLPALTGPNHDGGIILFGPDGKLYAVIGDLNLNHQTENYAGAAMSETAVVLRLNDDGTTPGDNPFSTAGWQRFYGYGVRNSYGMAFDPLTGVLWDTENGPSNYDEINRIVPGYNSGWEDIMGPDSRDPQGIADLVMISGAVYVDPAFSWQGVVAPTAIRFLDSCRWPASLRYHCFVGDNNFGRIYRFEPNASRDGFVLTGGLADLVADTIDSQTSIIWGTGFGVVTDIQIGPDGYMYVVSLSNSAVYRVRPQFPMGDINRDGTINATDQAGFISLLLGLSIDPLEIQQGDFDGSGAVDGQDIACFTAAYLMGS